MLDLLDYHASDSIATCKPIEQGGPGGEVAQNDTNSCLYNDLIVTRYGKLHFNLDYYTEVLDLEYLLDTFPDDNFTKKYKQLNEALTGLINDYRYN